MVNIVDIHTWQRVVIKLFTAEGYCLVENQHRCLISVCGEVAIDVSSLRCWVHRFKSSEDVIGDKCHTKNEPQQ
jgi:hypothetical protein